MAHNSTTDIVNALVAKGVLTEEEGALLTKGRTDEAAGQAKALKKASKLSVSDAIDKATVYGDIRVRAEHREGSGEQVSLSGKASSDAAANQTGTVHDQYRDRARYKMTLGAKTESGNWYGDLAFAMGAAGRSDNATFGKTATSLNDKETLFVKRAMVGYKATDWLTVEAGRMDNPLYTTPMIWDADLTVEGLVEKAKFKAGNTDIFVTAGQLQYLGDHNVTNDVAKAQTTELMVVQAGIKFPITDASSAKGALTYTNYSHSTKSNFTPGVGTYGAGNALTGAFSSSTGAPILQGANKGFAVDAYGVNDLNTIEIPAEVNYMVAGNVGVRLYGDYAYNISADDRAKNAGLSLTGSSGSDDAAWMLGLVVGSAKDLQAFEGNKMAKGDWQARIWYQDVGVWSVDPNAVDSDVFDSRVNMKGTTFKAQYNIENNVYANFAYGHATRKNALFGAAGIAGDLANTNLRSFDLVQLDLTYKF